MMNRILMLIAFLITACQDDLKQYKTHIERNDSLLVLKNETGVDIFNLNNLRSKNILFVAPNKRVWKEGETYYTKMFFINDNLFDSSEQDQVKYSMKYKLGNYETPTKYIPIETIKDTAYIHFEISIENKKATKVEKWWTGVVEYNIEGRDTSFVVQESYLVEKNKLPVGHNL